MTPAVLGSVIRCCWCLYSTAGWLNEAVWTKAHASELRYTKRHHSHSLHLMDSRTVVTIVGERASHPHPTEERAPEQKWSKTCIKEVGRLLITWEEGTPKKKWEGDRGEIHTDRETKRRTIKTSSQPLQITATGVTTSSSTISDHHHQPGWEKLNPLAHLGFPPSETTHSGGGRGVARPSLIGQWSWPVVQ